MPTNKIILLIISIIIVVATIGFGVFIYKMNQIGKMTSSEMIKYVTKNSDDTKISIVTIKNGQVDYKIYGKDGEEEYTNYDYEIGSISKTFVALLISKAIDEGKIDINDSINKYLDLDKNSYYPTIKRLITHTSGYKSYYLDKQMIKNKLNKENDYYGVSREKIVTKIKNINLEDKDYKFVYSNFGISVLGLVLEEVYNKDFTTLMNNYIKEELQFDNTVVAKQSGNLDKYWRWDINDGYIPAGAIISNIEDMSKYLKLHLDTDKDYIVNTHKKIMKINANNYYYESMNIKMDDVGMAWMIDSVNNIIWHNGGTSSYNSYMGFNKDKNTGVIVLGNVSPFKKIPMTAIGVKIIDELSQ